MYLRIWFALLLVLAPAAAQRGQPAQPIELNVRVSLPQGAPAQTMLQVQLLSAYGGRVAELSTITGTATFSVHPGQYRLRVSGMAIEDQTSDSFEISSFENMHAEFVQVRLRDVPGGSSAPGGVVSSADLNVPKKAREAYRKGNEALVQKDNKAAIQQFEKAIAEYPKYGSAHGALGLALLRNGDRERARQEFRRALELDPTLEKAYVNLGKLSLQDHEYAEAERWLAEAVKQNASDPEALGYLADAQFFEGKYDEVVSTSRKLHAQGARHGYAVTHFLAATALERSGRRQESAAEYRQFLEEDPGNRRAALAREALAKVEK